MPNEQLSERQLVARQIRRYRELERSGAICSEGRDSQDYISEFNGLQYFFEYVRGLQSSNTILAIGAGKTQAISELSQKDFAYGLYFLATCLIRHPDIGHFLGYERTKFTSAEVLRGFQKESIGGILAMRSIVYTSSPRLVIQRFNEVLVPGGVMKATFGDSSLSRKSSADFTPGLKELDYDLFVLQDTEHHKELMLAIKPNGKNGMTARKLLEQDYVSLHKHNWWDPFTRLD